MVFIFAYISIILKKTSIFFKNFFKEKSKITTKILKVTLVFIKIFNINKIFHNLTIKRANNPRFYFIKPSPTTNKTTTNNSPKITPKPPNANLLNHKHKPHHTPHATAHKTTPKH